MGRITGPPLEATCVSACPLGQETRPGGQATRSRTRLAACAAIYVGGAGRASIGPDAPIGPGTAARSHQLRCMVNVPWHGMPVPITTRLPLPDRPSNLPVNVALLPRRLVTYQVIAPVEETVPDGVP